MKRQLPFFVLGFLFLFALQAQAQFSPQNAVMEEFTGAWCGYCPEGASIMDNIAANESKAIPIAIHSGDAMETAQGDSLASFYRPSYPMAMFGRAGAPISRGGWNAAATTLANGASSVSVSFAELQYDETNRFLTAKVQMAFTGVLEGDLRVGLMILEDSVVGNTSRYHQTNYFNTTAGHEFQGAGNPIIGYVHRHVFREAVGSVWGNPGILPTSVNFGSQAEHTFQHIISPDYDINQVSVVAFVSQFTNGGAGMSDRKVLNGEGVHLLSNLTNNTSIDGEVDFATEVKVFPNPASDWVNFSFNLKNTDWVKAEIYDQQGRVITQLAEGIMSSGMHSLRWNASDFAAGMYLIKISSAEEALTRRIVVR